MFIIGEITVDASVTETRFGCDLNACKGACCTFPGGRGAPLNDSEIAEIERAFPVIRAYLPPEHRSVIERHGLIDGTSGNYATPCVDGKACVFVYYDGDIAKCSFERAFYEKKIAWQKPVSCHLFPVRIGRNGTEIHYEYFSECEPALARGKKEGLRLSEFAAVPLARTFGTEWNESLQHHVRQST